MLHRTRHMFIRQQTALINSIRAHLAEFGIVAPVGRKGVTELLRVVADPNDKRVPQIARACLAALGTQLLALKEQILEFDRMILAWHRSNQTSKRLHYIPGVGPVLLPIPEPSGLDVTSPPGSGWFPNSTQVGARSGSAASVNRAIAICGACSSPARFLSSAMPRSMAPAIGPGSRRC
jgi:hypothetical protein